MLARPDVFRFLPSGLSVPGLAGPLLLVIIICGIGGEFALRGPLTGAADPVAAIAGAPGRFRLALLADLVMLLADVTLGLVLFTWLSRVSPSVARAALVFRLMQGALIGMGVIAMSQVPAPWRRRVKATWSSCCWGFTPRATTWRWCSSPWPPPWWPACCARAGWRRDG